MPYLTKHALTTRKERTSPWSPHSAVTLLAPTAPPPFPAPPSIPGPISFPQPCPICCSPGDSRPQSIPFPTCPLSRGPVCLSTAGARASNINQFGRSSLSYHPPSFSHPPPTPHPHPTHPHPAFVCKGVHAQFVESSENVLVASAFCSCFSCESRTVHGEERLFTEKKDCTQRRTRRRKTVHGEERLYTGKKDGTQRRKTVHGEERLYTGKKDGTQRRKTVHGEERLYTRKNTA